MGTEKEEAIPVSEADLSEEASVDDPVDAPESKTVEEQNKEINNAIADDAANEKAAADAAILEADVGPAAEEEEEEKQQQEEQPKQAAPKEEKDNSKQKDPMMQLVDDLQAFVSDTNKQIEDFIKEKGKKAWDAAKETGPGKTLTAALDHAKERIGEIKQEQMDKVVNSSAVKATKEFLSQAKELTSALFSGAAQSVANGIAAGLEKMFAAKPVTPTPPAPTAEAPTPATAVTATPTNDPKETQKAGQAAAIVTAENDLAATAITAAVVADENTQQAQSGQTATASASMETPSDSAEPDKYPELDGVAELFGEREYPTEENTVDAPDEPAPSSVTPS